MPQEMRIDNSFVHREAQPRHKNIFELFPDEHSVDFADFHGNGPYKSRVSLVQSLVTRHSPLVIRHSVIPSAARTASSPRGFCAETASSSRGFCARNLLFVFVDEVCCGKSLQWRSLLRSSLKVRFGNQDLGLTFSELGIFRP